jgi:hypothetical protein
VCPLTQVYIGGVNSSLTTGNWADFSISFYNDHFLAFILHFRKSSFVDTVDPKRTKLILVTKLSKGVKNVTDNFSTKSLCLRHKSTYFLVAVTAGLDDASGCYFLPAFLRSLLNTCLKSFSSSTSHAIFLQSAIVMPKSKLLSLQQELRFRFPLHAAMWEARLSICSPNSPFRTFPPK